MFKWMIATTIRVNPAVVIQRAAPGLREILQRRILESLIHCYPATTAKGFNDSVAAILYCIATFTYPLLSVRARRRFSRNADRRAADPNTAAVSIGHS
jgi:hypothetical protein